MTSSVQKRPVRVVRRDWWRAPTLLLAVWIVITVGGTRLVSGGHENLDVVTRERFLWPSLLAAVVVTVAVVLFGWRREVGLRRPGRGRSYLPALAAVGALALVVLGVTAAGFSDASVVLLVNVFIVAFSEELMFRGVVFRAASKRYGTWLAIPISAAVFGAVHLFEVFITGNVGGSVVQAVLATMAGLWYAALRARGGSVIPLVIIHALLAFSIGAGAGAGIEFLAVLVDLALLGYGAVLWSMLPRPTVRSRARPATA